MVRRRNGQALRFTEMTQRRWLVGPAGSGLQVAGDSCPGQSFCHFLCPPPPVMRSSGPPDLVGLTSVNLISGLLIGQRNNWNGWGGLQQLLTTASWLQAADIVYKWSRVSGEDFKCQPIK